MVLSVWNMEKHLSKTLAYIVNTYETGFFQRTIKGVFLQMKRRTARERALQALYQIDLAQIEPKEAIMNVLEENNEKGSEFLESLVFGYIEHKEEIDTIIRQNLAKWKLERIGSIDRNILRVAVCEMKFIEDVPTTVSLNEAIEVAKVYGDEESKRFINAVLEKVKASMN